MQAQTLAAYHEAGHALACCVLAMPVRELSLAAAKAYSSARADDMMRRQLRGAGKYSWRVIGWAERETLSLLVGPAAEVCAGGDAHAILASPDLRQAREWVKLLSGSEAEANAMFRWLWTKAQNLVAEPAHSAALQTLATELERNGSVSGVRARAIIRKAITGG